MPNYFEMKKTNNPSEENQPHAEQADLSNADW